VSGHKRQMGCNSNMYDDTCEVEDRVDKSMFGVNGGNGIMCVVMQAGRLVSQPVINLTLEGEDDWSVWTSTG